MTVDSVHLLSSYRRRLVARLLTVSLVASLLSAATIAFVEKRWLDEAGRNFAAIEARHLTDLLSDGADKVDAQAALQDVLHRSAAVSRDFFVSAGIRMANGDRLAHAEVRDFAFAERRFEDCRDKHPERQELCELALIDDAAYVRVSTPLSVGSREASGHFEGIFRLSPETLRTIHHDNLKIISVSVGAVLLTLAALYPLLASLQGHIVVVAKDLLQANIETLKALGGAIAKRDSNTGAHNYRVTLYAIRIAEGLGRDKPFIRGLIKGALLHDIGKIAIHDSILRKPGPLDEAEFTEMKSHVVHGMEIISGIRWLADASGVVGGHHEKVDGSGYPEGLVGNNVPLAARVFAVADVFDALTTERPYKKALPLDQALRVMTDATGTHFDSRVLDCFLAIAARAHGEISERNEVELKAMTEAALFRYFEVHAR